VPYGLSPTATRNSTDGFSGAALGLR